MSLFVWFLMRRKFGDDLIEKATISVLEVDHPNSIGHFGYP